MNVSTRTPEGLPSRCPLCGTVSNLEYSDPAGDAPCPNCGHLLWLSSAMITRIADSLEVPLDSIAADTLFSDLGDGSLDTVELVMELEEEFDVSISDDSASRIKSVSDAMRYIERRRRADGG